MHVVMRLGRLSSHQKNFYENGRNFLHLIGRLRLASAPIVSYRCKGDKNMPNL